MSFSFFACNAAADHTFRLDGDPTATAPAMRPGTRSRQTIGKNARVIDSAIVLDALKQLKMADLKTTAEHRAELEFSRKELAK